MIDKRIKICDVLLSYPIYGGLDLMASRETLMDFLSAYDIKSFYVEPAPERDCSPHKIILIKEKDKLHWIQTGMGLRYFGERRYGFLNLRSEPIFGEIYLQVQHISSYSFIDAIKEKYNLLKGNKITLFKFIIFLELECNKMQKCYTCGNVV